MFYKFLTLNVVFFTLVSCTGGSESGDDASVARGGDAGGDDYGVEIPVATSLTLADFGLAEAEANSQIVENRPSADGGIALNGDGAIQSISTINFSSALAVITAIAEDFACTDASKACCDPTDPSKFWSFVDSLPLESPERAAWMAERRRTLSSSLLMNQDNGGALSLDVLWSDATVPERSCMGIVAVDGVPAAVGYQGFRGNLAFVSENAVMNGSSQSSMTLSIHTDQFGLMSKSVPNAYSCDSTDPACVARGAGQNNPFNWSWNEESKSVDLFLGASKSNDSMIINWGDAGQPSSTALARLPNPQNSSDPTMAVVFSGDDVGGTPSAIAVQTPEDIRNTYKVTASSTDPIVFTWVANEKSAIAVASNQNFATSVAPIHSIPLPGEDPVLNAYRFYLTNASDRQNPSETSTRELPCTDANVEKVSSAVQADTGYFGYVCGAAGSEVLKLKSIAASGTEQNLQSDLKLAGQAVIDLGANFVNPAWVMGDDSASSKYLYFAGNNSNHEPAPAGIQLWQVDLDSLDWTSNTLQAAALTEQTLKLTQGLDTCGLAAEHDFSGETIKSLQGKQDKDGRHFVLIHTEIEGTPNIQRTYMGTPFPNNEMNLACIESKESSDKITPTQMILYGPGQ